MSYDKSSHGKRYTLLKRKRALALLRRKNPVSVVARSVGASPKTVRRWAAEAKLELPIARRQYNRAAILSAFERGRTVVQVCGQFGCSERYARAVKSGELA